MSLLDILPWADVPYEEQLVRRRARVAEALRRGRVEAEVAEVVPSPRPTGARARVKLRAGPGGRWGFHRPGTHEFIEIPLERLARPEVVAAASRLGPGTGEVELRSDGSHVQVVTAGRLPPPLKIGGLRVSARSFYQVNLEVNARIREDVDALLHEQRPAAVLDLYGGIGNLTAGAAARAVPVTLVESEASAVDDARHNLPGATVVRRDVARLREGEWFFDVVVLDPPRAGAPGILPRLAITRPRLVLYLSCEPVTLARDIATLLPLGYRVERVQPYDMFPDTEHVETLAVLSRGSRR